MIKRPDCFDFAMDFLGDWEATEIRRYVEGLETDARKVPDDGLASFAEYFCHNYPSDTIIGRPEWHAPKIFRAAIYAINDAAKRNAAPPARESKPANAAWSDADCFAAIEPILGDKVTDVELDIFRAGLAARAAPAAAPEPDMLRRINAEGGSDMD